MDDADSRALKLRARIALGVAAVTFAFLGLAGPIALATGGELASVLPFYPPGWAIVFGCYFYWSRCWRRLGDDG
jgi:hypothetical protein